MKPAKSRFFVIRDAVHGDIYLTREEGRLLDTAAMQRLRGVRQLGTAYLVYPGANHTRFEHSIGSVHMAQRMIDAVNRSRELDPAGCLGISPEEGRIIRIAALLHDVTHIPFGHSIEDQTGLFARHDTARRYEGLLGEGTELGSLLEEFGVRDEIFSVLAKGKASGLPAYWSQIMSDTICADIFDYLKRDAYFTGLNLYYDERLVNYFRIDRDSGNLFIDLSKHAMLREDILSECIRLLEARYFFSERVYYHHAKIAAGALVAKAAEHAVGSGALEEEQFYDRTDASLIDLLAGASLKEERVRARMARLLSLYRQRKLPKRAAIFPVYANREIQEDILARYFAPGKQEARAALEETIAARAGQEDVDVILYCPQRRMQLKEARMHVRWPGEKRIRPLNDFGAEVPRLQDLEERYRNLWKFFVFATTDDTSTLQRIQKATVEEFPGATNVYQL